MPDSVNYLDATVAPQLVTVDSVVWLLDSLAAGGEQQITVSVQVSDQLPDELTELISTARLETSNDSNSANNFVADTVRVIFPEQPPPPILQYDLTLTHIAITDTTIEHLGTNVDAVQEGDSYDYSIQIENFGPDTAKNFVLQNIQPDSVTLYDFSIEPDRHRGDTLFWNFESLPVADSISIDFKALVADSIADTPFPLVNTVELLAANDTTGYNNVSSSTVYAVERPQVIEPTDWELFIEATPATINVGDPVSVRVMGTAAVKSWDLWIYTADNQIDSSYADGFIAATQLEPNRWIDVEPVYIATEFYTQQEVEPFVFEFYATDSFDQTKSARAEVTVQREEVVRIDRNIYVPDRDGELEIKFKLENDSEVRLEVFDITGTRITKLTEQQFKAGWNTFTWNGLTDKNQKIGSGFYILTIRAANFNAWKKLMIVR